MRIQIITVCSKMPRWVTEGYEEYAKRLPKHCSLSLCEIPLGKRRSNTNIQRLQEKESQQMLSMAGKHDHIIALEAQGAPWSTEQLANELQSWRHSGTNVSLLVGGPEGIASKVSSKAHQQWSLSSLTLPHTMVRLVIAEQIYRAWSIINHHPYHR